MSLLKWSVLEAKKVISEEALCVAHVISNVSFIVPFMY